MNLPNILTLSRIIMIPLLVVSFYWLGDVGRIVAAALFAVASVTDWLDGYLARKLNQTTPLGAFLDPVADKLIVSTALILLVEFYASFWITMAAMVIIGREIVISALREWMAELGKRSSVAVSYIGKVKTTMQMLAIILLLGVSQENPWWLAAFASLIGAAFLTLWSMFIYLKAAWADLSQA